MTIKKEPKKKSLHDVVMDAVHKHIKSNGTFIIKQ